MAMFEFLIVLPVLLMLLFATIEFGVVMARWQTISNAAREGSRYGAVFRDQCTPALLDQAIAFVVKGYAQSAGVNPNSVAVTVTGSCDTGLNAITRVEVDHTYNFKVLGGFTDFVSPAIDLHGESAMRNERQNDFFSGS
ncbi:MAG TPA: TadE/TadG family type IV pilus assembly protein [Phycisphaerae bacterium]|nr:TadE/TadG family type IV pilus assembly protein [Phycisphaerae bacterium]